MNVQPQIVIGNPLKNIAPDPIQIGYGKYNEHTHLEGGVGDVRYYPWVLTQPIELLDSNSNPLFEGQTYINKLQDNLIFVDRVSINSTQAVDCKLIQGNFELKNCRIESYSSTIEIVESAGMTSGGQLRLLMEEKQTLRLTAPIVGMEILAFPDEKTLFLKQIQVKVLDGSASSVIINWLDEQLRVKKSIAIPYPAEGYLRVNFNEQTVALNTRFFNEGLGIGFEGLSSQSNVLLSYTMTKNSF